MNCDEAREATSALLDGEPPGVRAGEVEQHLAGCPACRAWQEAAHQLTRRARLQPAPAHQPGTRLFEAIRAERQAAGWRAGSMTALRVGLLLVALGELAVAVPALLFGHDHAAPIHVAHEMGSFDVAVAIGFLAAARRPGRAMGMLSLVGAAAGLLVLTAAIDLLAGRTDLLDEAPHLLVVVGWLLLWRLALVAPPSWERPGSLLALSSQIGNRLKRRTQRASVPATGTFEGDVPAEPSAAASEAATRPDEAVG